VGAFAAALVLVAVVVPQAGARTECTPGAKTVGGVPMRTFCGPAKATVHYGSQVFTYANGSCQKTATFVVVNIGTEVLGTTTKPKPDYFGLDVGQVPGTSGKPAGSDGVYTGGVLALIHGGKGHIVFGPSLKIALSGGRSHGTFSGKGFSFTGGSPKVTGTFSCS
jgi:hypothetical protein